MTTNTTRLTASSYLERIRSTDRAWYALVPRLLAGLPLFAIGLMHVFVPEAPMRPLVDAMGLPLAAVVSPLAVAIQIVAGASLLAGAWARVGAFLAIPVTVVALYSHYAIEVWPNEGGPPPDALPIVVILASAYVLWRGAGRWSIDRRLG